VHFYKNTIRGIFIKMKMRSYFRIFLFKNTKFLCKNNIFDKDFTAFSDVKIARCARSYTFLILFLYYYITLRYLGKTWVESHYSNGWRHIARFDQDPAPFREQTKHE